MDTSWSRSTRGVISKFTPTSTNWKLTTGVPVAPTKAGWKLPDAIGTCEPMRMEASFPSVARMRGFCNSRMLELVARNCATVGGMVSEKLFPFRVFRLFNGVEVVVVVLDDVVPVDVLPVVVVVVVLFPLLTFGPVKLSDVPCGGNKPSWRR